ncbi:MAG TPA: glycosyltransferase family 2 protein [Trebonia sp.]
MGLPVYNAENFINQSIDALLGQTYGDFELVISDNASTDGTEDICRIYEKQDSRIRYIRQPRNIGLAPNHNFTLDVAGTELFKWAAHDDLYARDLLQACVTALDERPDAVLAHSWTARIDGRGNVTKTEPYPLDTSAPRAPTRFRSTLFGIGGDDDGGVIRTEVLRRVAPCDSYHHADRTQIAELALHGPFHHIPEYLYFRRDHPERAEEKYVDPHAKTAHLDPRRADRLRNPAIRLYGEYLWGFLGAVNRSPLSTAERRECYRYLAQYLLSRARIGHPYQEIEKSQRKSDDFAELDVSAVVAGQEKVHDG